MTMARSVTDENVELKQPGQDDGNIAGTAQAAAVHDVGAQPYGTWTLREYLTHEELKAHLSHSYDVEISEMVHLDVNVYRVTPASPVASSWVARVFAYSLGELEDQARIIKYLQNSDFPAESVANDTSVSICAPGFTILTTQYVLGSRPPRNRATFRRLGELLGVLHALPLPTDFEVRQGGAWHHLSCTGGIREEIAAAINGLKTFHIPPDLADTDRRRTGIDRLLAEVHRISSIQFEDLPAAIVHPDFVPSNIVASPSLSPEDAPAAGSAGSSHSDTWTVVDWTNVGRGVRVFSLAPLLTAAAARDKLILVDSVMAGYCSHVTLTSLEVDLLADVICVRPLTIACWEVLNGRKEVSKAVETIDWTRELGRKVADRVKNAVARGSS